jgi:hypothetical protein
MEENDYEVVGGRRNGRDGGREREREEEGYPSNIACTCCHPPQASLERLSP